MICSANAVGSFDANDHISGFADVAKVFLELPPRECFAMKLLVTGGAGFIGSAVCRLFVGELGASVLNVDKLTYAANLASLRPIENHPGYRFERADITDPARLDELLGSFQPDAVL